MKFDKKRQGAAGTFNLPILIELINHPLWEKVEAVNRRVSVFFRIFERIHPCAKRQFPKAPHLSKDRVIYPTQTRWGSVHPVRWVFFRPQVGKNNPLAIKSFRRNLFAVVKTVCGPPILRLVFLHAYSPMCVRMGGGHGSSRSPQAGRLPGHDSRRLNFTSFPGAHQCVNCGSRF